MSVNIRIRNGLKPNGSGVGGASEGDLRGDTADLISQSGGVVDLAGGGALVHEASPQAMTVVVDKGVVYVPNDSFDYTDSDSIKFWEAVLAGTLGSRTLVIGANSSGQTRIDLICVKLDTGATPDNTASNVGSLIVVAGTPGAGIPATPANYYKLASVTVANGAIVIANASILDTRVQLLIKEAFAPVNTTNAVTLQNKTLINPIIEQSSGWQPDSHTWTYSSVDGHTFVATVNADVTNYIGLGDKIWVTNQGVSQYFFVTKISFGAGITTITLYGGTNYSLTNTPITAPYYSHDKNPFGFNLDPALWTEKLIDTSARNLNTPSYNTWYNLGLLLIAVPIGVWVPSYSVEINGTNGSIVDVKTTLSTANNTESDTEMTANGYASPNGTYIWPIFKQKPGSIVLTAKTTFYLNALWNFASSSTSITFQGDRAPTTISFRCAYL